ncbi:DUF805 domain-containing protein [uncultured Arcticibacterium sp.]|uniref:DUF805 domain-containing protein n=1 Tax=uncultured Arcticibacterium sp. TaxID=2173042 RepID=UPI0030FB9B4B
MNYFLDAFRLNYANFEGRARREEYWMFILFHMLTSFILVMMGSILGEYTFILLLVYVFGAMIPNIAVLVRRLHDVGKSGWFYFISLIPLVGPIWMIVLLCTDSDHGPNEYGENPKGIGNYEDDEIDQIGESL